MILTSLLIFEVFFSQSVLFFLINQFYDDSSIYHFNIGIFKICICWSSL